MRWIAIALLFASCEAPKRGESEHRFAIEAILMEMAEHLGSVESAADFSSVWSQLEADYMQLAHELAALEKLGAKAPATESVEFLQTKERIGEHLGRIREMEGGVEWLRDVQRRAHTFLIDIET